MALTAKTNTLTGPSSTGNSATTDPGFQPKALMIWSGLQTATGAVADAQFGFGVASSTTTENVGGYNSDNGTASSDVVRVFNTAHLIQQYTAGTTTLNVNASLTSFDATGYTLNWETLTTTSPKYNYLALGGSDITNVISGNFAASTSTGNQAVTGVGFQPDIVFFFFGLNTTSVATNSNTCFGVGVAKSASQRWAASVGLQHNVATMNHRHAFYNNACLVHPQAGANSIEALADFVSMDTDGFTINWSDAPGQADLVGYLAIKGGQWKVGTDTQKTSTGTKATTGTGFAPQGVLFASNCDTTANSNSVTDNARMMMGVSTGASNNTALWTGDQDNVADANASTIMSDTKALVMATEAGASPTTNAEAAISSLDSDGFTLDWTTADATAREFGYVAFGAWQVGTNTEVLVPNADPDVNTGWPDNGGNTYTKVNSDDGDTSYIYTPTLNSKVTYPTQNSAISSGTIHGVTVKYKVKALDPVSALTRAVIRVGGTDYVGQTDDTSGNNTSYLEFAKTWYTNPNTGVDWTWSDIDSMQIGIEKMNTAGQRATYIYAVVDYTPSGSPAGTSKNILTLGVG